MKKAIIKSAIISVLLVLSICAPLTVSKPDVTFAQAATTNTVVSTELINYYSMTTSEIQSFLTTLHNQGITTLTVRINSMNEFRSNSNTAIAKIKAIIPVANAQGISVNVDLHTWYTTWDTYFRDSASNAASNRNTYINYVKTTISAFNGYNVNAFMVLNEPQARTASTSENNFILNIISAANSVTSKPISVRFMAGYSPSTGHYSSAIDQATDFLARNTYWDARNPSTSVYGSTEAKLLTAISTAHSQNKQLWITEFGKSNSNLAEQQAYVKAFVAYAKSKGNYNLSDNVIYLEAGLNLTKAWNVTVQNVRIQNCVNGVSLVNSYYCRVQNCTLIENAVDGIKIVYSANNSIVWNEFVSNSDDAIQLVNAQNNSIMVNNLNSGTTYRSNGNGFQLNGNCSSNLIEGNAVTSFDTGIFFDTSTGSVSANVVSYNNFTTNKWNGAFITGTSNNITLNNFYNNGLLLEGDSNCSGNYWSITPSVYDNSPRDSPVNMNITPEFIELPQTDLTPTNTPNPTDTAMTPTTKPAKTTSPTATPKETAQPTSRATPMPTANPEPTQPPVNLSILLVITAIISASVLVCVPLLHRGRVKGLDKKK